MNIYDVSEKAGVSIATVSRVLNGNSNVSEKTKQKVLAVMEELGYVPNVFARGLGLNSMNTVGIMCADSSDIFLANAIKYIERELRKNGYDSFLCCTGYELKNKQNYLSLLLSKRVDAIILIGSTFLEFNKKDNQYIMNASKDVPIILINGYLNNKNIYCTLCDDIQSSYEATKLLYQEGRRRPLFLYSSKSYSSLRKLEGYQKAVEEMNHGIAKELIHICPNTIEDSKNLLLKLSNEGLSFDSVFAAEDILAVGAIKYAKEQGLNIPKDLSVIGYNNSILATCCEPELTSIDNHVEAISITSVNALMRVLNGEKMPNKHTISNDLVIRKTTKK